MGIDLTPTPVHPANTEKGQLAIGLFIAFRALISGVRELDGCEDLVLNFHEAFEAYVAADTALSEAECV